MGVKICYLGELDRTPDAPDHLGIRQGLEKYDSIIVDPILNNDDQIVKEVAQFNPDVIVHGNTDTLRRDIVQRLKIDIPNAKQVFWMLDYQPASITPLYNGWWDKWTECKGFFDAVFLSNYDQLSMWADGFDCSAFYLPHGCVVQDMVYDEKEAYDTVFIGSMTNTGWYKNRVDLLNEIGEFTHINGDGVEGRNDVWKRMPAIYHSSTTILDIAHEWNVGGYSSGRYFYSSGLGGCAITKRFPRCEELYRDKDHKLYFDNASEARELIEKCKKDPSMVAQIKVNAWHHNKDYHNYELRFKQMISKL